MPSPAPTSAPMGGATRQESREDDKKRIERELARCAAETGLTGKVILLIHADGRIEIKGGSPAFRQCLERNRTLEKLAAALPKGFLADPGRPAIVEVTLR